MLFSQAFLRRVLGVLWLLDGLLQLQPKMMTMDMVTNTLTPVLQGQPTFIAANLQAIFNLLGQHITLTNLVIAAIQCEVGLFLLAGIWIRGTVIFSLLWSLIVWYVGEGLGMLLTGQASALTGAPGSVLLYPLLALLIYPRKSSSGTQIETSLLTRTQFIRVLAGFWLFAAFLQLQPYWWQSGQISQTLNNLVGQGGFNSFLIDPILRPLSIATTTLEIPLNVVLIEIFYLLGIALLIVKPEHIRPWLLLSLVLSLIIWWGTQAFGMIFTGLSTDFNSGLLLVLLTLACWPKVSRFRALRSQISRTLTSGESPVQLSKLA